MRATIMSLSTALLAPGRSPRATTEPRPRPSRARHRTVIPPAAFTVFKEDSGPVNYYSVGAEDGVPLIRGVYRPGLGNVVLKATVPEQARQTVTSVSWRWRAHVVPPGRERLRPGRLGRGRVGVPGLQGRAEADGGQVRLEHGGHRGDLLPVNRGWFFDRDTILVQVGGPLDVWNSYAVDPRREFVKHYGGKLEDVPDFVAIGVMTDGDNSQTPAEADYADFVVEW